ncbi:HTTM domain-containing protein [Thalassoroseus pseudoceratinae]|uniref:HTTM domain-containing protein n=1 Tax=Thalassoroseus pseudoceratinae TaxID=2713176 RepID=UPI00141FC389|nr:HTTM domain-containing protein [Thalassoroseus pseudoceratinae]
MSDTESIANASDRDSLRTRFASSFTERLYQPVPNDWLIVYRISFGVIMTWFAVKYIVLQIVDYQYILPAFHFTYYGFDWIKPWPVKIDFDGFILHGMHIHFYVLALLSILITIGLRYRLAAFLYALAFTYVFLIDKTYYQNHYYLVTILSLLLPLLPANQAFSCDALLHREIRSPQTAVWTLWLMRFVIALPYVFGGISKLNGDWLRGQPMRYALANKADTPFVGGPWFTEEWFVQCFVWGGLIFDLAIVPALLWKPTRKIAFITAIGFHLTNALVWPIGIFPWLMMLATTVFFEPDWPRRLWAMFRLQRYRPMTLLPTNVPPRWQQRMLISFLGAFVLFHVLMPFRHYVLPGNPSWNEYAHHFSWHMLVRGKISALRIYVTDPQTGITQCANPAHHGMNGKQYAVATRDPRMIHQMCQHIHNDLLARGYGDLEVRVLALVSLNGRRPQMMVDPSVNLAAEPRTWRFSEWILPLTEPYRHRAWDVPVDQWEQHLTLELPVQLQIGRHSSTPRANPVY